MKPRLYLINGPLGAGKTTVLKYLLSLPDFSESRVIENEFANYSVDTHQLHDHEAEIQTIAGVCICCSTGDELNDALKALASSNEPVIIEATGVANSLRLIEKLALGNMFEAYELAHGIFVLDAREMTADIQQTLDTYHNELLAADTVIVSKSDLVNEKELGEITAGLRAAGVQRWVLGNEGAFDASLLRKKSGMLEYFAHLDEEIRNHDENTSYTVLQLDSIVFTPEKLSLAWETLKERFGLKRMKGEFTDPKNVTHHVEATPHQIRFRESKNDVQNLVCIGTRAHELTKSVFLEAIR